MEKRYEERIAEIDARIADLNAHRGMWAKSGGGKMAMQAVTEIEELKAEKARIMDGSQKKIDKIQEHISELQQLKAQCHMIDFMKKMKLNGEIKNCEKQKNGLMTR